MNNKLRLILVIILIIVGVISILMYVGNSNNNYTTLHKEKHFENIYTEIVNNDEKVKYTDTVSFRENLSGGPYYFEDTIKVNDLFVFAKIDGYLEGLTDTVFTDLEGNKVKDTQKYVRVFVKMINNSNETVNIRENSFKLGYTNDNDVIYETELPNNERWGKVEQSFAIQDLPAYTQRSGYIYFPINDVKVNNLYLKVATGNVPLIITKK